MQHRPRLWSCQSRFAELRDFGSSAQRLKAGALCTSAVCALRRDMHTSAMCSIITHSRHIAERCRLRPCAFGPRSRRSVGRAGLPDQREQRVKAVTETSTNEVPGLQPHARADCIFSGGAGTHKSKFDVVALEGRRPRNCRLSVSGMTASVGKRWPRRHWPVTKNPLNFDNSSRYRFDYFSLKFYQI